MPLAPTLLHLQWQFPATCLCTHPLYQWKDAPLMCLGYQEKCLCMAPCNWPYTHAWNAGNMQCKNWVLGNQSQGLVVVEAYLLLWMSNVRTPMTKCTWKCSFLYLIHVLLLIENLWKIWLESPSIYLCLMLLAGDIHQLVASIFKSLQDLKRDFPMWWKLIAFVVIKAIVIA